MLTTLTNHKTYCPLIEHGLYLERTDANTSKIGPCCAAIHESAPNTQINFDTNTFLLRLRKENRQGVKSAACQSCYDNESFGAASLRTASVEYYNNFNNVKGLYNLDYNVDPICNAKCIICSQQHSSAWLAEDIRDGMNADLAIRTVASSRANTIIETFDLSGLGRIYFNGGEPMLSDDPIKLLTKLKEIGRLGKVEVAFNMNGSVRPRPEFVELLKQAQSVTVFFSIDGVGEQFEYIRNPLKWSVLLETVQHVIELELPNLCVVSTCTVGVHNVDYVNDWHTWWHDYAEPIASRQTRHVPVKIISTVQRCTGPLDIMHAPIPVKQQWLEYLQQYQTSPWYSLVHGAVQNTLEQSDQSWKNQLDRLDIRRGNSWHQSLARFYQRCQTAGVVK